jgi:cytochrome c-type biogenesis protein CcmH/NrfG
LREAATLLEATHAACRRALASDPASPRVQWLLASAFVEMGRGRDREGDPRAARARWEEALAAVDGIAA